MLGTKLLVVFIQRHKGNGEIPCFIMLDCMNYYFAYNVKSISILNEKNCKIKWRLHEMGPSQFAGSWSSNFGTFNSSGTYIILDI